MNAALFKRWKISETLLQQADAALPRPENADSAFEGLETQFTEYMEHNEHGLALDTLVELGDLVVPRGGFWKDLIRAAENMELSDRIPELQKRFDETPARKCNTGKT